MRRVVVWFRSRTGHCCGHEITAVIAVMRKLLRRLGEVGARTSASSSTSVSLPGCECDAAVYRLHRLAHAGACGPGVAPPFTSLCWCAYSGAWISNLESMSCRSARPHRTTGRSGSHASRGGADGRMPRVKALDAGRPPVAALRRVRYPGTPTDRRRRRLASRAHAAPGRSRIPFVHDDRDHVRGRHRETSRSVLSPVAAACVPGEHRRQRGGARRLRATKSEIEK